MEIKDSSNVGSYGNGYEPPLVEECQMIPPPVSESLTAYPPSSFPTSYGRYNQERRNVSNYQHSGPNGNDPSVLENVEQFRGPTSQLVSHGMPYIFSGFSINGLAQYWDHPRQGDPSTSSMNDAYMPFNNIYATWSPYLPPYGYGNGFVDPWHPWQRVQMQVPSCLPLLEVPTLVPIVQLPANAFPQHMNWQSAQGLTPSSAINRPQNPGTAVGRHDAPLSLMTGETCGSHSQATNLPDSVDEYGCSNRREHQNRHNSYMSLNIFVSDGLSNTGSPAEYAVRLKSKLQNCSCLDIKQFVINWSKNQCDSRVLQQYMEENEELIGIIFEAVQDDIAELIYNYFANNFVQKLWDLCVRHQKMLILRSITARREQLVKIAMTSHGSLALQHLVRTLEDEQQVELVVSTIRPAMLSLVKDKYGVHFVVISMDVLKDKYDKYLESLLELVVENFMEICTSKYGHFVVKKCLEAFDGLKQEGLLVDKVITNARELAGDEYGNFVIQYELELGKPWAYDRVYQSLKGHFRGLSKQKHGCFVVQRCLELWNNELKTHLVHELLRDPEWKELVMDRYGSYVILEALRIEEDDDLVKEIVDAIKPFNSHLLQSRYGEKVYKKMEELKLL